MTPVYEGSFVAGWKEVVAEYRIDKELCQGSMIVRDVGRVVGQTV